MKPSSILYFNILYIMIYIINEKLKYYYLYFILSIINSRRNSDHSFLKNYNKIYLVEIKSLVDILPLLSHI